MNAQSIFVNLGKQLFAAETELSLSEIAKMVNEWPEGATCVTQESDGELMYWDAPLDDVVFARKDVGTGPMLPAIGLRHQIHSAYCDLNNPKLATDWHNAVVPVPGVRRSRDERQPGGKRRWS